MVLDFGVVGDLFQRTTGEGDVEASAGNRVIPREMRTSTRWNSPAEFMKPGSEMSFPNNYSFKSITFVPNSSSNVIIGVRIRFDAKAAPSTGTLMGIIVISGVNNDTESSFKNETGGLQPDGFPVTDDNSYHSHDRIFMLPDETAEQASNDSSYLIDFRMGWNGTSKDTYLKNVIVDIYYLDYEDLTGDTITD